MINGNNAIQRRIQDGALERFAPTQSRQRLRLLGEVARHLGKTEQLAFFTSHARDDHVGPEFFAVFADPPAFLLKAPFGGCGLQFLCRAAPLGVCVRVKQREVVADDLLG